MISNNLIVNNIVYVDEEPKASNRNIPEPIKRKIRQRCGFGCVICGNIIYDYDHMMQNWADVQAHLEEDITLLCTMHHREKTNGLLTKEQVKDANSKPFNLNQKNSPPHPLHFSGETATAVIASNYFSNDLLVNGNQHRLPYLIPVLIDDLPIVGFRFEDEQLLLLINLFNEFNELIFGIFDNQLILNPDNWDVEWKGSKLIVREKPRVKLLEIEFSPPNQIVINKAKLRFNGVRLEIMKDHYVLNGVKRQTTENFIASPVGISVGKSEQWPSGIFPEPRVNRYK